MIKNILKNSLHVLREDTRDFNLGAVFKQIDIKDVPDKDFIVAQPLIIKCQPDGDDECSAYAVTSVSEDQEGVELLPQYQFLKTKEISGNTEEWGANLRDACKSAVKFGSLPVRGFEDLKNFSRVRIFKEKWPSNADAVAELYKKASFFSVTGRYDVFDNIRTALWQNRNEKRSIVTGALFRSEWLEANYGVVPKDYGNDGFGHAFKIFGQAWIAGELHLIAQLSQGERVGNKGIFYFPREVVNKEIGKYGVFMFKDISKEEAQFYIENHLLIGNTLLEKLWSLIKKIFTK